MLLFRFGLLILACGLFADLAYHSLPLLTEPVFGSNGVRAHLVVFSGMLLVVGGLIQQGTSIPKRSSSRHAPR